MGDRAMQAAAASEASALGTLALIVKELLATFAQAFAETLATVKELCMAYWEYQLKKAAMASGRQKKGA
eukprot:NODE_6280_length_461_cov_216.016990_g4763_i0.p2 GENE.NODE_6280_length_461_cov_216.016990_g4763_i0~~NODE_6280_length_461_cov_216.016990_g4763_i0.p2  ORF type:complete len:69 (-),score=32.70 NODE_6280_length_461_cov_216.016990_g4763_i0:224-430(-)